MGSSVVTGGRLDTGGLLNTLIQQTVLVMKQNKLFRSLSLSDQSELCQANVMVAMVREAKIRDTNPRLKLENH